MVRDFPSVMLPPLSYSPPSRSSSRPAPWQTHELPFWGFGSWGPNLRIRAQIWIAASHSPVTGVETHALDLASPELMEA